MVKRTERATLSSADLVESFGVPEEIYPYSAGVVGGILGGAAMAFVAIISGFLMGRGPWYPLNLVGATLVRSMQTAPAEVLSQFHLQTLIAGFALHMLLSATIGLLFALLLPTLPRPAWLWSLVIGTALWFGAQFVVLPVLNPIMTTSVWLPSFLLAHLVYALVLGTWIEHVGKVPVGGAPLASSSAPRRPE